MRFTQKQIEDLTDSYSDIEIGKMFNCKHGSVRYYRKKYGVKSFTEKTGSCKSSEGVIARRGITDFEKPDPLNISYFKEIDTPIKAYWIGLIASDGCISKDWRLEINLQWKDKEILQTFADCLNSSDSLKEIKREHEGLLSKSKKVHQASVRLCSKQICLDLEKQNITQRKSKTVVLSPCSNLFPTHYLRGYLDGNGYIGEKNFMFSSGSEKLIDQIRELIYLHTNQWLFKEFNVSRDTGGVCFKLTGYRKNYKVLHWLYSDCSNLPCIERKRIKFSRYW